MDYHFGRLTPAMNRAVEAHIAACERCKREGLKGAAAQRQAAGRRLRRVRGGKPFIGPRGRIALLTLALLIAIQFVLVAVTRGQAQPLLSAFNQWRAPGSAPALDGASSNLTASARLPAPDAGAIALSADGATLAVAQGGEHPAVTLWNTKSRTRAILIPWTGAEAPATLAWSPDGALLAVSGRSQMMIWSAQSHTVVWQLDLPDGLAARIYDVQQQAVIDRPDPASLFASGPLVWGADGALSPAPAGANGPTGITSPQTPVVGLWSSEGAHLFGDGQGAVHLGVSAADIERGDALLNWAPGGRYLLFARLDLPITGSGGLPDGALPNSLTQTLVAHVLGVSKTANAPGERDALLWFSPDARHAAVCDRTQPNTPARMYNVATGAVMATLEIACGGLPSHAAQWSANGATLYIASATGSIAIFSAPQP